MSSYLLTGRYTERPWGVHDLRPWFDYQPEKPVGEVWFNEESAPLMKFIFTRERLSVQVHPDDAYAARRHGSPGKTEAWCILAAQPGACIGLGFRRTLSREEARQAALDGSIEELLDWRPVQPGDMYLVPAGTVHAIGPGLVLFEVQQPSDVTYRLYDYGRPRELHLESGFEVAHLGPYEGRNEPERIECPYFRLERRTVRAGETIEALADQDLFIVGPGGQIRRLEQGASGYAVDVPGEILLAST